MKNDKIIEEINIELKQIDELLSKYDLLLREIKNREPNFIELGSLSVLLHSFYTGIENIFIRISKRIDNSFPDGTMWHKELLEQMSKKSLNRNISVISKETYEILEKYLGFRHLFRHNYVFNLTWDLMKDLVIDINNFYTEFKNEIREFIKNFLKINE